MDRQIWDCWLDNWEWTLSSVRRKGCEVAGPDFAAPVTAQRVGQIQSALRITLPVEFVHVLTHFASRVSFRWHLGRNRAPGPYRHIFASWAEALWDANSLERYHAEYEKWVRDCFRDPEDPYDAVWHGKTPFMVIPNGDMIAFDPSASGRQPVIYLSHDDGELHGCKLGTDFPDFITRWSNVGCPGPEDWQIAPFYDAANGCIMNSGEVVDRWREWINQ